LKGLGLEGRGSNNDAASRPNSDHAHQVCINQFNALKFENCKIQSEVYKSLFEPQPSSPSPFKYHEIPGTIFGSDYDIGGQGVGYYDLDYKNTGSGSYNQGWAYRNNGVDLERCSDFKRNGYNVGWIESGEWLKFTADIIDSGFFNIDFRFASTTSDGIFLLDIDTDNLLSGNIPLTGDWQSWQTIRKDSIYLPSGTHTFMLRFFKTSNSGGFNFNYFEISPILTEVEEDSNLPSKYNLFQNYPNPFNPSTILNYNIPELSDVQINLYNSLGEKVNSLFRSKREAGNYEYKIIGSGMTSGVYFCELVANSLVSDKDYRSTIKMVLLK
jgi:hypothetical protein